MMTDKERERANVAIERINIELERAFIIFPRFVSTHEGYAVIKEKLDELWEEAKKNNISRARQEAIQVGAMAIRFLIDIYEGE